MSRQARVKSESGIYHVMLRGINHQQVFLDAGDYKKFLEIVEEYKGISGYKVYAYCLMGNHVHLLIKTEDEGIEQVFKRIGARFVYWYNIKYQRSGHLFQDRFRSEPVETDEYFLTVLRYIHQNPIKGGLCKRIEDYPYSSYNEFANEARLIDTKDVYEIIDHENFVSYHKEESEADCLDVKANSAVRLTDEQAQEVIKKVCKCENVYQFAALDETLKVKYIPKIRAKGLSIRQIARLTGISKGIIERILRG